MSKDRDEQLDERWKCVWFSLSANEMRIVVEMDTLAKKVKFNERILLLLYALFIFHIIAHLFW